MRQLIADLRGGIPDNCDCCGQPKAPDDLDPVSGGEWICTDCYRRDLEQYGKEPTK